MAKSTGVTNIMQDWNAGNMVFFEEAIGRSTSGDVLTIGTTAVTVGNTGQDVDFIAYAGSAASYFKVDAGAYSCTYTVGYPTATGTFAAWTVTLANTVARTSGTLKGASVNVNPLAANNTGAVTGLEACVYIGGTTTVSGMALGLFAEIQGGTTISSDYYAIYAYSAPSANPSGTSAVIRLEHNGSADNYLDAWICCVGGKGSYWLNVGPLQNQTAWGNSGTPTGAGGWLKVLLGTVDRYIPLYTTAP